MQQLRLIHFNDSWSITDEGDLGVAERRSAALGVLDVGVQMAVKALWEAYAKRTTGHTKGQPEAVPAADHKWGLPEFR